MKLVMDETSHLLFSKSRKVTVNPKTATHKNISKSKNKTTILIFLMMAIFNEASGQLQIDNAVVSQLLYAFPSLSYIFPFSFSIISLHWYDHFTDNYQGKSRPLQCNHNCVKDKQMQERMHYVEVQNETTLIPKLD
jgi:hypothetical protein